MASDWLQIPGNDHAYERLRDIVASGKAIAFVGAGASAGLYPLWPELICRLANAAVRVDHRNEENLEYWLKADPQEAIDQIRDTLKGSYRDELREIFSPRVGNDGNRFTPVHASLLRLPFRGFVTTNYDTALLEARQKLRPDLPFPAVTTWKDNYEVHRWRDGSIFKEPSPVLAAHGSCQRSDTIVLGTEDYSEAYNTEPYASLFKHLWGACQLVFVGFGFSDPWLKFLAGKAIARIGAYLGAPKHRALVGLREVTAIPARQQSFRKMYNADPVFYPIRVSHDGSEDHSALLSILQALVTGAGPSGAGGVTTKGGGRSTRKGPKPVTFAQPASRGRSEKVGKPPPSEACLQPSSRPDPTMSGGRSQYESYQQDQERQEENKKRLQKLKKEISKVLSGSDAALTAFHRAARSRGWEPVEEVCGHESSFIEWLMNADFSVVKDALLEAHENLNTGDGINGPAAIEKVSRLLLPWLYVAGYKINTEWWDVASIGDLVGLPCGLTTFAEIVMAGLERREVLWRDGVLDWPSGQYSIFPEPESGIEPKIDKKLRDELWNLSRPPRDFENRSPKEKDEAIANQLEHFDKKGIRFYVIFRLPSHHDPEHDTFEGALLGLTKKYRFLSIVELDESMLFNDQRLFNEIRHLLVTGTV